MTPPSIQLKRDEHKSNHSLEVLLVTGILLISIGGYTSWFTLKTQDIKNAIALAAVPSPYRSLLLPRLNPTQTANWETYTSQVGGFSFKYPATGWSLGTFDDKPTRNTNSTELTGNETRLFLTEHPGTGQSDTSAQFTININIAYSAAEANSYNGYITPKWGSTLGSLSNGIKVWQTSKSTYDHPNSLKCGYSNAGIVWLGTQTQTKSYTPIPSGKYVNYIASFCQPQTPNKLQLGYGLQARGSEMQVAQAVLSSITYK